MHALHEFAMRFLNPKDREYHEYKKKDSKKVKDMFLLFQGEHSIL